MIESIPLSLVVNAIAAPLSLALLLLLTWSDLRREINSFLAVFLFFVVAWNGGALIVQAALLADLADEVVQAARIALDLGFIGAGIAAFALTAVVVKAYTRRMRVLALLTLMTVLIYRFLQLRSLGGPLSENSIIYRAEPLMLVFFALFGGGTLLLLWQHRRSLRSSWLRLGLALFVTAQLIGFTNPELGFWFVANNLGAIAALFVSMALVRQEITGPLAERTSQVETLRRVISGLINQESLEMQLAEILRRAAALVQADGAGMFRASAQGLLLIETWELPPMDERSRHVASRSIAWAAMEQRRTIHVDNYAREWRGPDDFPHARAAFGSVVCTPIPYGDEILGVLMVVSARQGHLFRSDDLHLLEMLAAQVAVTMTYHKLFERQKELDRIKNEMLRMASHDLKNPLQASLANLELLEYDLAADPREDVQEALVTIHKQLKRMGRIIRGVLDLEKLREGKIRLTPRPVSELIERAVDEIHEQATEQGVALIVENLQGVQDVAALCDAEQMERALVNLLENGIKFTRAGGDVRIGAHFDAPKKRVVISVRDTGAGIAEAHQPHIFERFYRASPQGMEHVNGSGLGLSLVKAAVHNHHGDIWFQSREGIGTSFFIGIPAIVESKDIVAL